VRRKSGLPPVDAPCIGIPAVLSVVVEVCHPIATPPDEIVLSDLANVQKGKCTAVLI
jgi:hypothetical protein